MAGQDIEARVDHVHALLAEGRVEDAMDLVERLLEEAPDDRDVRLAHAAVVAEDDAELAASILDDALERFPNDPLVLVSRASWEVDEGDDLDAAQALLDEAIAELHKRPADDVEAQALLGESYRVLSETRLGLGDLAGGLAAATRAAEVDREDPRSHQTLAWARFVTGDTTGADAAIARALEIDANLGEAYRLKGHIAAARGRPTEADRAFLKANALDPEAFPKPIRLSPQRFKEVALEALSDLPPLLADVLDGVAIDVEARPDLAAFRAAGVPVSPDAPCTVELRSEGEASGEYVVERVLLFQENLEVLAEDDEELAQRIIESLLEELGAPVQGGAAEEGAEDRDDDDDEHQDEDGDPDGGEVSR